MTDAVEWWWRWPAVAMAVEAVVPVVVVVVATVKWRSSVVAAVSIHILRTVVLDYGELLAYWFTLLGCST